MLGEPLFLGGCVYAAVRYILRVVVFTDWFGVFCRKLYDIELRWFALADAEKERVIHFVSSLVAALVVAVFVFLSFIVNLAVFGYVDATALKHLLVGIAFLYHVRKPPNVLGVLHVLEIVMCVDVASVFACAVAETRRVPHVLDRVVSIHKTIIVGDTRFLNAVIEFRLILTRLCRDIPHGRQLLLSILLIFHVVRLHPTWPTLNLVVSVLWFAYHISAEPKCLVA